MAHREVTAYRRLKGIDGVPRFLGRNRSDGLLLEYIEGHNCMEQHQISLPLDFFNRLQKVLNAIRNRGVLRGDIKRNVLATPTGNPVILNFGASFVIHWWLWPLRNMIFAIGAQYDNRAVVRIKQRIDPDLMTPTEIKLLSLELPFDDIVRLGEKLFSRLARWALRLDRGSVS